MGTRVLTTTRTVGDIVPLSLQDGGELDSQVADAQALVDALGSTFVFSPSNPAPGGNVYNDWGVLQTAYLKVAGPKWIQFDPTFAAITIPVAGMPAGGWSLEDATCVPSKATTTGTVNVTWQAGAQFQSAHLILQGVVFTASASIFVGSGSSHIFWRLENESNIQGGAGEASIPVIFNSGDTALIIGTEASSIGDAGGHEVIDALGTSTVLVGLYTGAKTFDHALVGANTATLAVNADPSSFASQVVDGSVTPVFFVQAGGSEFVFDTSGTPGAGSNVYNNLAALYAATQSGVGNFVRIYVKTSAVVPKGTWAFQDVEFVGDIGSTLTFGDGAAGANDAFLTYKSLVVNGGLQLRSNNVGAAVSTPAASVQIKVLGNSSSVRSIGAQNFAHIQAAATFSVVSTEATCTLGDATHNAFTVDAGQTLEVVVGPGAINAHAIAGAGTLLAVLSEESVVAVQDITTQNQVLLGRNFVQAQATITPAGAAPYNALVSPAITRKGSGIFQVFAFLSVGANAGSLVAGDGVSFTIQRVTGALNLNEPLGLTAAVAGAGNSAGDTIVAACSCSTIDDAHATIAWGSTVTYALRVLATNGHTSGVVAVTDGFIYVVEL